MNRLKHFIIVLTALSLTTAGWAEQDKIERPLRLELDLVDGSHIIGVPSIESVPVQAPYAKMDIPLKQIRSIKIENDHETASFDLQNGDKLKGAFDLGPIALDAIFGKASVRIEHIKKINILQSSMSSGLVLHYSFDHDKGDRVVDQSGRGYDGTSYGVSYEKSINGKGIHTTSSDTYVTCNSPDLSCDGWRQLTVAAWVKVSRYATYGRILNRGKEDQGGGGFGMSVGGTYGGKPQQSSFGVRLGDGKGIVARIDRFAELDKWYHIAGVYDGRTVKYYVNGEMAGSTDVPDDLINRAIKEEPGVDLMVGKCSVRRSWHDTHINGLIDEVMIFDQALTENQIRQMCNAQNQRHNRVGEGF